MTIQYAAGFFDGEGSVTVNLTWPKGGDLPTPHVRVSVSNYIQEPIVLMKKRWGGSIHVSKDEVWAINLNGEDAKRFLLAVRPYLIVKRKAAAAALKMFEATTPKDKVYWALQILYATREGYRAKRSDFTLKVLEKANAFYLTNS